MSKIGVERSHVAVYRHIVVVEDDQQVVGRVGGIVETLECKTAADGGVADHGYNMTSRFVMVESRRYRHSQGCRDGVGGMAGSEGVIFAFVRIRKAAQSAQTAVGVESLGASGE